MFNFITIIILIIFLRKTEFIKLRFPTLLIKKQLVKPIETALNRLNEIRNRKISSDDSIIREGLFVLSVSTFENALLDSLRIFLKAFPQKLSNSYSVSKKSLISDNILLEVIDGTILKISYKNIEEIFKELQDYFGIDEIAPSQNEINIVIEFKASRNLLIHNNLVINNLYESTAGALKRSSSGRKLEIDDNYLANCLSVQTNILNNINNKLSSKYNNYTKIAALKELWTYTFGDSSILTFEEEWEVNEDRDSISAYKAQSSKRNMLSSGERILFDFWLTNIIGENIYSNHINFHRLDSKNLEIVSFLVKKLDYFKSS